MKKVFLLLLVFSLMLFAGCAKKMPEPSSLKLPTPILDNSGKYYFPYTQDGVLTEWTDKVRNAGAGAGIGKFAGSVAGEFVASQALGKIPLIGGWLGGKAGEAIGRKIVIENAGGWDFIKSTSDITFNNLKDYSIYLYAKYSNNEHYQYALKICQDLYPKLKKKYVSYIMSAGK